MQVEIIDMRGDRRETIAGWLKGLGHEATPSPNRAGVLRANPEVWPDLLLLHVGADQDRAETAPSSVEAILKEYSKHCWLLGYFGGAASRASASFEHDNFCLVRDPVKGLDEILRKAVSLVLQELQKPTRGSLAEIGKVVNGFDFVLEAKLRLLAGLLGGGSWEEDADYLSGEGILVAKQSAEIAKVPQLSDRVAAIADLHRRLFPHRRLT